MAVGFLDARLTRVSAWLDSRLRKRYEAPFASPYPEAVLGWLVDIVTEAAYRRRGLDPNDPQAEQYAADANTAREEVKEAADAEKGAFDLPLRQNTTADGITKGGPLGYSEQSPYVGFSKQRETAQNEDCSGTGTGDGA